MNTWRLLHLCLWLLALTLVIWTLRQLPLDEMLSWPGRLTANQWLLWGLVNAGVLYLAVQRWQLLALALGASLSLSQLFRLRQSGSTVSFITPGPQFGGEPLQLYWLHRYFNLPLHRAATVLGLDRFLETGTNTSVLLAGMLTLLGSAIMPIQAWLQVTAILISVLAALLISAALILRHPEFLVRLFRNLVRRWPVAGESGRGEKGWTALVELLQNTLTRRRPQLWMALLLALLGWVALLTELVLLLRILGLTPTVAGVLLIMVGMRLAMLLPIPGGIGTIEASLLWSFGFLGLPLSAAAGLIALMRLRDALLLLLGLGCLAGFRNPPCSDELPVTAVSTNQTGSELD
jgi:uncharacterized protein (TIRG00374 family)